MAVRCIYICHSCYSSTYWENSTVCVALAVCCHCQHATDNFTSIFYFATDTDNENVDEMVAWLTVHHQPQSKLLDYWRKTAKPRLSYIHGENMPDINSICLAWPRYCDRDGFLLVCVYRGQVVIIINCREQFCLQ